VCLFAPCANARERARMWRGVQPCPNHTTVNVLSVLVEPMNEARVVTRFACQRA